MRQDGRYKVTSMLYILTIQERAHSWAGRPPVKTVHQTRAQAEAELADYVRRNWDSELDNEAPANSDEMIESYFADVLETYDIREERA